MRLSFVLLVATVTALLSNSNAATASDTTLTAPDSTDSLGASQHAEGVKRYLRKYDTLDEEEDSEYDEEDRLLEPKGLEKALTDRIHRTAVFKLLARAVGPPNLARSILNDKLYDKYRVWFYHIRVD
ncbi:unnamed protein product [Phytophthora fragariaefolia]|uniref:RxLR effector protein n=1 Tax=Phytophthora fragariaefolia TaxID=1490495 RepID=A0A9W6YI80_9STRA|nr:unnamed protein product [Phytophthora fragariaefolia]